MQLLIYRVKIEVEISDWRFLVMDYLEYQIVCEASQFKIYGYTSEDLAQESRLQIWSELFKYNHKRAGLHTWARLVIRSHLNHLNVKATGTQKRKDYLTEPIHEFDSAIL